MSYVVHAAWIAAAGNEEAVRRSLADLAEETRTEPGNQLYVPYEDPDAPGTFGIFEVYDDERAFDAHVDSEHFRRLALNTAIPLLRLRSRHIFTTLRP